MAECMHVPARLLGVGVLCCRRGAVSCMLDWLRLLARGGCLLQGLLR